LKNAFRISVALRFAASGTYGWIEMPSKRVIFAGIIGRYPVGGVTWCALHYIAGFQALGYEVFYLEDTGEWGFDPIANSVSADPAYALGYIKRHLALVGLDDAWTYVDVKGRYHGKSQAQVAEICAGADLMVNLSGGYWPRRAPGTRSVSALFPPEYERLPKIFIDTDPGFTQLAIERAGAGWYRDFFAAHHTLFTFALNVASPECRLVPTPFHWHPTVQPIALDFWPVLPVRDDAPYTTIMSWRTESFRGIGKDKALHLYKMIDLPTKLSRRVLLAIAGQCPVDLLTRHHWDITDGVKASIDASAYRGFIQASRAELGFAKPLYVETRSGWVSDRTICYLASGRPAVVRDTGLSDHLPCGTGLLVFEDENSLLAAMDAIEKDYAAHSHRARSIAEEFFAAEKVVDSLLCTAGLR
jgi:hypothetical protein